MLGDCDVIRNLLGTYCRLIDAGDFAAVGEMFAHASVCGEEGTVMARGADEVEALYCAITRRHDDGTPLTQHIVANTIFEVVDDDTIRAQSAYVVLQATPSLPLQPIITGTYLDTFVRTTGPERWRFAERRFGVGRTGDLSQHLAVSLSGKKESA